MCKGAKNTQWRKDCLFNKWCLENWIFTYERMKMNPYLTLLIKINSKWINDLNERPEAIKFLEENTGRNFLDIGLGNDFFGYDTLSTSSKNKNQVGLHQTKNLHNKSNRQQNEKATYRMGINICKPHI